jgi:hypothetical protein
MASDPVAVDAIIERWLGAAADFVHA